MQHNEKNNNNKTIKFPCDFPIKVIGYSNFELEDFTEITIHKHLPHMEFIPITKNESKKGNYQAITAVLKAENQQQLDAVYRELTANKHIIMVL